MKFRNPIHFRDISPDDFNFESIKGVDFKRWIITLPKELTEESEKTEDVAELENYYGIIRFIVNPDQLDAKFGYIPSAYLMDNTLINKVQRLIYQRVTTGSVNTPTVVPGIPTGGTWDGIEYMLSSDTNAGWTTDILIPEIDTNTTLYVAGVFIQYNDEKPLSDNDYSILYSTPLDIQNINGTIASELQIFYANDSELNSESDVTEKDIEDEIVPFDGSINADDTPVQYIGIIPVDLNTNGEVTEVILKLQYAATVTGVLTIEYKPIFLYPEYIEGYIEEDKGEE